MYLYISQRENDITPKIAKSVAMNGLFSQEILIPCTY